MALSRSIQRRLAYGGNATLVTVLVVVLVGVLYGVADRNRWRVDLTSEGSNTLQEDTLKKLELLDGEGEPVTVTAFTSQEGKADSYFKNRAMKDLLLELDYRSSLVTTRFVDFDRERLTAEELGVREYGHLVVQRGDERVDLKARELFRTQGRGADRELEFLGEAAFNRAASQLLSKRRKTIYSLVGHGELKVDEPGPDGLSVLKEALEQENYDLEPLDLYRDRDLELPLVPADASALFIVGPKAALTDAEEDAVTSYVARGGALLVAIDPGTPVPGILDRLGVTVPDGVVADRQVYFPFPDRPVVQYGRHSIVEELAEAELYTVLPHIAPVRVPDPQPEWMSASEVLRTSRDGWIDRGGATELGRPIFQPETDVAGPHTYAWALELRPGEGSPVDSGKRVARVLVFGDSEGFSNDLITTSPGNATLLVNSARWELWDDARLSVIGAPTAVRRLALTEEDQGRIRFLVLGLLPLLVIVLGGAVWAARRGR